MLFIFIDLTGCSLGTVALVQPSLDPALTTSAFQNGQSQYELVLHVHGTCLKLYYHTALFTEALAADLLQQYVMLLEQTTTNPERGIYDYSLVTEKAKELLPDATAPQDTEWAGALHHCFHQNALKHPKVSSRMRRAAAIHRRGECQEGRISRGNFRR